MTTALFVREHDLYVPQANAAGPWGGGALHGGSTAGLIAHVLELARPDEGMVLSRITIDLFRVVPSRPLRAVTEVVRPGKRIQVVQASLWDGDVEVCRALGLMLRTSEIALPTHAPTAAEKPPGPDGIEATSLRGSVADADAMRLPPGLHTTIEVKRVSGEMGRGAGCAWIRVPVEVVEGVPMTPSVRAATVSDFGNGIGQLHLPDGYGFINADITLHLAREPQGEWINVDAKTVATAAGLGTVETLLFDAAGAFGQVSQSILANRFG